MGYTKHIKQVLFMFALSNMAALIYQISWTKSLSYVFGTSVYAVGTVLACFMAGLALGSFVLGKKADKSPNPLRLFSYVELTLGLSALFLIPVFAFLPRAYASLNGFFEVGIHPGFLLFALSFQVLIIPTSLIGGTFPIMNRIYSRQIKTIGEDVGIVYSVDTVFAAIGALSAGFFLLPVIGISRTVALGAVINILAGIYLYKKSCKTEWTTPLESGDANENRNEPVKPVTDGLGRTVNFLASIPVGDIDGDGADDAVILTQDLGSAYGGKVWAIKATGTRGTVLWSSDLGGGDARGAAIGDLNGGGVNEVVVSSSSGVFIFDKNGTQLYNFRISGNYRAAPVIADIDGDGINEVLVASRDDNKVYIISNGMLRDFPAEQVSGNVAAGDINKDGKLEMAAGNQDGVLYVWDYTGKLLDAVNAAKKYQYFTSVLIADLEGDGRMEIILGNKNGNIFVYTYGKKDITPPATIDNVDSAWYNTNVTITLEAKDDESGVAATYYTVDGSEPARDSAIGNTFTLSGNGVYTIRYFSVDKAGNAEPVKTASNNVKIDKIPPSTTDNADGLWHNGSTSVTLTANDGGSGVAATYYTLDDSEPSAGASVEVRSEGNHTIKYYSVDKAGNVEQTREAVASIDRTSPAVTDDSDSMWHNSEATLNITAADGLSGAAFIWYKSDGTELVSYSSNIRLTFTEEGVHEVEYYAVDNAGNAGEVKRASVKIDKTPPSTTDDADGVWHNGNVIVKLAASDNLSGVRTTSYKVNSDTETMAGSFLAWFYNAVGLAEDATPQGDVVYLQDEGVFRIQYNSIDNADNIETEKISKQVKIDETRPVITVNVPEAKTYLHSDMATLDFGASDSLSGVMSMNSEIDGINRVFGGQVLDMLELSFGTHEFQISAVDNAGNRNSKKTGFNVIGTVGSVKALTDRGVSKGWISNKGVANSLSAKLNSAGAKIDAGQKTAAKNILEAYVNEVEAQSGKNITPEWAVILIAEARYVIENM